MFCLKNNCRECGINSTFFSLDDKSQTFGYDMLGSFDRMSLLISLAAVAMSSNFSDSGSSDFCR